MRRLLVGIIILFLFTGARKYEYNPHTGRFDGVGVDSTGDISDLSCADGQILKWNDAGAVWECKSDDTGAGGTVLGDVVTTTPLKIDGAANKNDIMVGADADYTWSIDRASSLPTEANGYMPGQAMTSIDVLKAVSMDTTTATDKRILFVDGGRPAGDAGAWYDKTENSIYAQNVSADTVSVDTTLFFKGSGVGETFISSFTAGDQAANWYYTLPVDTPSAGEVLEVAAVAGNSVTLEWDTDDGGAGAGDVTDVYSCNTGDCSDLTGVAGDKLDLKDADSSIPWPTKTPEPTTEGMAMWKPADDTLKVGNSVGTETFYPGGTMTDTNFCKYDSAGLEIDCATAANAGTDITADLEEEAHVSEHQENGADELLGEAMGTACSENQILKANATGGLDCAADAGGSSKWRKEFQIQTAKLPLLNPMALDAGKSYWRALADTTTPERLSFDTMLPNTYTGGAVSFDITFSSSAAPAGTNDGVVWVVMNQCIASNDTNMIIDGQNEPHFYAQVFAPCKAPQAIGNFYRVGVPIPSASWDTVCGANSLLRIMVSRDTTSADDTYASDAELVKVVMYEI